MHVNLKLKMIIKQSLITSDTVHISIKNERNQYHQLKDIGYNDGSSDAIMY